MTHKNIPHTYKHKDLYDSQTRKKQKLYAAT